MLMYGEFLNIVKHFLLQLSKTSLDEDAQINKKLPKELLLRYLQFIL